MGKVIGPPITESDRAWLEAQRVFFHATAPLSSSGKVNVSPKSAAEFRVVDESTVCWLDYSGSGSETSAHLLENGRLTIMFVALEGGPRIVRLYGYGRIILPEGLNDSCNGIYRDLFRDYEPGQPKFDPGFRCIVVLSVDRVSSSCGYSIPTFQYVAERDILRKFSLGKGPEGMNVYRGHKNSFSIDGLPSIGQLLMKSWPSSIKEVDGYYLAEYDGNLWNKVLTFAKVSYIRGDLSKLARNSALLLTGFACGMIVCVTYNRKSIRV